MRRVLGAVVGQLSRRASVTAPRLRPAQASPALCARQFASTPPRGGRVLASSHGELFAGPVDSWLRTQVDVIVTAMPAMRGPADQGTLRQLVRAAENLESTRSMHIEFPEPSALDQEWLTLHQPKLQKALKAASLEALPLEKRVAVLRGTFTSLLSKLQELEQEAEAQDRLHKRLDTSPE